MGEFQITTTPEATRANTLPNNLRNIRLHSGNTGVREYSNSRLRLMNNPQALLALVPFTMYGKRFYFQTYREQWPSTTSINDFLDVVLPNQMKTRGAVGNYHHHIFIYNTGGSYNEDEIFHKIDIKHPLERMLASACALSPGHRIRIVKSKYNEDLFVFTSNVNHGVILKLIAIFPLVFPSLAPDKLIAGTREAYPLDLFIKLGNLDYDGYMEQFHTWWLRTEEDRQRAEMLSVIVGLGDNFVAIRRQQCEAELQSIARTLEDYTNGVRDLLASKDRHLGALAKLTTDENPMNELEAYLPKKREIKHISRVNGSYTKLHFRALQAVDIYDQDAIASYVRSGRGNMFTSSTNMKDFFDLVFVQQKYTFWVYTPFTIDFVSREINDGNVDSVPQYGAPNPHFREYHCWGDNKIKAAKAMQNGDFVVALEQVLAACRSLNFYDGPVMNAFTGKIREGVSVYTVPKTIQNVETGEWLSLYEFIVEGRR